MKRQFQTSYKDTTFINMLLMIQTQTLSNKILFCYFNLIKYNYCIFTNPINRQTTLTFLHKHHIRCLANLFKYNFHIPHRLSIGLIPPSNFSTLLCCIFIIFIIVLPQNNINPYFKMSVCVILSLVSTTLQFL